MSLIERALQKGRKNGDAPSVSGAAVSNATARRVTVQPVPITSVALHDTNDAPPVPPDLVIDETFLREKRLRAMPGQESQQRAEYRHIKHTLLNELRASEARRLLLVTSALQGEGKSFSAAHLALSLALEPDFSVLLVDADVIRPNLSRMFAVTDRLGLMDAVVDPMLDVQSLILTTNIDRLSVLPAGRPNENATEYFASSRMHDVMEELLAVPNRLVIVDSLPLLLTTEARAMSSVAGQIVLVVRAESTPQTAVLQAIELLGEGANVRLLLNAVVRTKALKYLGYGYGYTYNEENPK